MPIWPAAIYDAIKASADAHGGIGSGANFDGEAPLCVVGHAIAAGILEPEVDSETGAPDRTLLLPAHRTRPVLGLTWGRNDTIVNHMTNDGRIPFDVWARAARVERGP